MVRSTKLPNGSGLGTKSPDDKLTVDQLAEALYEGSPHLQNLAEKLARQHGKASALSFYSLMGPTIRNFWRGIAQQLIDHAKEWDTNQGSACRLSMKEVERLISLPVVDPEAEDNYSL